MQIESLIHVRNDLISDISTYLHTYYLKRAISLVWLKCSLSGKNGGMPSQTSSKVWM